MVKAGTATSEDGTAAFSGKDLLPSKCYIREIKSCII
jgi:hypothetical protein